MTDAVVVNRVFPDEVDGYFGAWRAVQAEQLELVESGFAPVPVLRAPYFEREVLGPEMLDRLGAALFAAATRAPCCTAASRRSCRCATAGAEAAARPAVRRQGRRLAEEDRARARGPRRRPQAHILLPGAMAAYRPSSASLAGGSLVVGFTDQEPSVPEDPLEAVRDAERLVREATERAGGSAPRCRRAVTRRHGPRRAAARRRSRTCPRWPG